jgi:hypothetical protein
MEMEAELIFFAYYSTLKMELVISSEISVSFYQTTWRLISKPSELPMNGI